MLVVREVKKSVIERRVEECGYVIEDSEVVVVSAGD
jgi:hypothetical protein